MTTEVCGHRKHTPIVSEKQRRFFGYALSGKVEGLSKSEAMRHLKEVKGRELPENKGLGSRNVKKR